jgi:hydroxymethylglutaryl-CoA lyase/(R)-citramalyl-CoA lyase
VSVARRIEICEVGPRDGLQNESRVLDPQTRAELCSRLADAGLPRVEAVSFVSPKRVPAMAGAEEVVAAFPPRPGLVRAGLIVNERGYDRARTTGLEELHYAFPATETFCQRNQGTSVVAAVATALALAARAREDEIRFTVTIGAAFGCPFEGRVPPERVIGLAERLRDGRPDEILLADTIGVGVPRQVHELVTGVAALEVPVGCHFHNTRNTGYANAMAAVEAGVSVLDAASGGTGGCPFAPRATGNIATEDLVYLLHGSGYDTGIDLSALFAVSAWLSEQLGKELPGLTYKAGGFPAVAS